MKLNIKITALLLFFFISSFSNGQELDSLKRELKVAKEDTNKVDLLYKISRSYILSDLSKQPQYIDEMLELSKKLNYHQGIGRAYLSYADHYLRTNVLDKTFYYLVKADSLCDKGLYDKGIPVVNNLLAEYYRKKGEYEQSLINYQAALSYYEKVDNKRFQGITLSIMSNLFYTMKRYKESEKYKLKALQLFRKTNDIEKESQELSNLALLYITTEEYEKAEKYFDLSMKLQEKIKNKYIISKIQLGKGTIFSHKGMYKEALEMLKKSYFNVSSIPDTFEMSYTRMHQANVYREMKEYDSSISYMDKAISLARLANADSIVISEFYFQYYQIYKESGNYEQALKYYEKAIENQSELFSTEAATIISELKEKYEAQKKEEEILLLREQNKVKDARLEKRTYFIIILLLVVILLVTGGFLIRRQIKLKQQKIAVELENKALRAQMNPHFIFNALNSIQRIYVEGDIRKANDFMADFAQLMRKILENSGSSKITLTDEIETLRLYMDLEKLRCKDCFQYTIKMDETISSNLKVPPLLVQPFVENSIWHGVLPLENNEGVIDIEIIDFDEENIQVIIRDNGVGFDTNSYNGNKNSKGIAITRQRIDGDLVIESVLNKGTTVSYKLKKTND